MKMLAERRALDKIYRRRDRYEIPDWQRGEVWDDAKKQRLIDSILRGWKLPEFYLVKSSNDEYEVVDGQQRLLAIFEFCSNELSLSPESAKEFGGALYRDLPQKIADSYAASACRTNHRTLALVQQQFVDCAHERAGSYGITAKTTEAFGRPCS